MKITNRWIYLSVCRWIALVFSICLIVPSSARSQTSGTGSIQGLVADPTGALVAGAKVEAVNIQTGVAIEVTTNKGGHYVIPLVLPDTYKIVVSATGFSTATQSNITVDALAEIRVDVRLSLSGTAEVVTVTGEEQGLATQDMKLGSEKRMTRCRSRRITPPAIHPPLSDWR